MPADEVGQCHHHAPLSTLLLSAVHPVTLYTHSAKHRATASSEQCKRLSPLDPVTACPLSAAT
jgi:hypothetical protein